MDRKRWLLYGLVGGLVLAATLTAYFYYEYMGEDTDANAETSSNSIIIKRLNAIVLRTTMVGKNNQQKLNVFYTDLDTEEKASFTVDGEYRQRIHVGDTLTKDKNEKLLFVYQKAGKLETVPID